MNKSKRITRQGPATRARSRLACRGTVLTVGLLCGVATSSATFAQELDENTDLLKLGSEASTTPFALKRIQLLTLEDLAAGTPMALDQFEPREMVDEFVGDGDDTARDIAVDEVRLIALENNLDLQARFVQPEIARERVREEKARFESVFSGSFAVNSQEQLPPPPNTETTTLDGYELQAQLDFPLHTGGTITLAIPSSFSEPRPAWCRWLVHIKCELLRQSAPVA